MTCPSPRWSSFLLATLLAELCIQGLRAQTPEAPLTQVKAVLALSSEAAAAETKTARLRGVVMDVSARGDEFTLHDGEACVSVAVVSGNPAPTWGSEVEIEGTVFSEPFFERKRTRVKIGKLTVTGTGKAPDAKPVSIKDAAQFKHLDQWVSVEGTVLQVRSSMSLFTIQLAVGSASCNVLVRDWPRDAVPRDWIGGRVRVSGVNRAYLPGSTFYSLITPSSAQATVIKTGVADPMDAPITTVSALIKAAQVKPERVKLTGTLLGATQGNVYYARGDDGGAFSFYMLHPIDEDKSGRFSTPIIMPACKPGDVLEVVGIPGRINPGVHLEFGVVRVLRSGPPPSATVAEIASILEGRHVHDLVEVEGRLLSLDDVLVAPGRWRTTMRLSDADHTIIAFLDASSRGALNHLQREHLLRVHGVVTGAPHFPEIRLWVPTPEDIQSLGVATDALTRRLWTGLGIAVLIAILFAGWALMLRRSRRIIRDLNATLETRVAERTAELAAAKDDLARALSQERELNELKSRFVSLVSHEFRTPLGVTMSAVELLRHFGSRITPEKNTELLEDIFSSTLQMSGLMEQVLLLGKAEAGKLSWHPAPINLPEVCQKLVDESLSATHQRCPIHMKIEGDFQTVQMDESLLRHIVGNLLSNAVKYSPEGSPVDFSIRHQDAEVILTVVDHGIGIPAADQPRLFEAFHRASNVGETPGTGLGLLLVKHCVELHQGRVSLQSQEGSGTTFTVHLPVVSKPIELKQLPQCSDRTR